MRQAMAIVVGGVIGLGLMILLDLLFEFVELWVGAYAFLVSGIVVGLLVGSAIGILSRGGVFSGLVLMVVFGFAGAIAGLLVSAIGVLALGAIILLLGIGAVAYLMAGFITGILSGVSYDHVYNWGLGAALPGSLAGILLLGFYLIYGFATGSMVMEGFATVLHILFALVLGALGGAVGGQLVGAKV